MSRDIRDFLKLQSISTFLRGEHVKEERAFSPLAQSLHSVYQRIGRSMRTISGSKEECFAYPSIDTFLEHNNYADGVHKICIEHGVYLDILLLNKPFDIPVSSRIPVFFSGAVTNREGSVPPYFSGKNLSRKLRQGIVAISDPIFYSDEQISTGWYTGLRDWHTQSAITRVLAKLGDVAKRSVLCVGGSAGGFAALEAASQVNGAAAFVWNAQTSILEYQGYHIRQWMNLLFGVDWSKGGHWRQRAQALLAQTDIVHDLNTRPLPEVFLYLQNDTDWHVESHMFPYVSAHGMCEVESGVYQGTERQVVALKHFAHGHERPSMDIITRGIQAMIQRDIRSYEVCQNLFPPHYST